MVSVDILEDLFRGFGAVSVIFSLVVVITGVAFPDMVLNPRRSFSHILFFVSVCDMFGEDFRILFSDSMHL